METKEPQTEKKPLSKRERINLAIIKGQRRGRLKYQMYGGGGSSK